jgi:hypothetical protein
MAAADARTLPLVTQPGDIGRQGLELAGVGVVLLGSHASPSWSAWRMAPDQATDHPYPASREQNHR